MKMVDIVTQTMPAESEVHVARNFLTKILRSSMRKNRSKGMNDPTRRPHSWHSSKLTENLPEMPKIQPTPGPEPVWLSKYDNSSPSNDLSSCWRVTNQRQSSSKSNTADNVDCSDPTLPAKPMSCIDLTGQREYLGIRGLQSEQQRHVQIPVGNGGRVSPRLEDQTGSRYSSSSIGSKSTCGPVWHVPEPNNSTALCPSPPMPLLHIENYTVANGHDQLPNGDKSAGYQRVQNRMAEQLFQATEKKHRNMHSNGRGPETCHSYNSLLKNNTLHQYLSPDDYSPNQLNPHKHYSLSSTDVRQGQSPFASLPDHQRQHSDESHLYLHTRTAPAAKIQSVGSYYRSLQELPGATSVNNHGQIRTSTSPLSSPVTNQTLDKATQIRYYCITAQQPAQTTSQVASQTKVEVTQDKNSQKGLKSTYNAPQQLFTNGRKHNGYISTTNGPRAVPEGSVDGWKAKGRERINDEGNAEVHLTRYPDNEPQRSTAIISPSQEDPIISLEGNQICPQKTPMLHSLSQENNTLGGKQQDTSISTIVSPVEYSENSNGKQGRRSDRYATTLRNEIATKRAQLQKSRSAATLTCATEVEEETEAWRSLETSTSSSDGSFTSTYKDNLKEAQARVLQATSFKRRDLELPASETFQPFPSSVQHKKNATISDVLPGKPGSGTSHVSRIGSRKRFPVDKRVHSFSEPDKINEVGIEGKILNLDSVKSFVDRCMFFEGVSKPAFPAPTVKNAQPVSNGDHTGGKTKGHSASREQISAPFDQHFGEEQRLKTNEVEQHRLGTFAEYEATWNMQRRNSKSTGRFHSAENIIDSDLEEKNQTPCVHERSRSSPSADFNELKVPLPLRTCCPEHKPESHISSVSSLRSYSEAKIWEKPGQPDHFLQPPVSNSKSDSEQKSMPAPHPIDHRHQPNHREPSLEPPPNPGHSSSDAVSERPALPKKKASIPQRSSPPKLDNLTKRETTSSPRDSSEFHGSSQAVRSLPAHSPGLSAAQVPGPAFSTSPTLRGSPCFSRITEQDNSLEDEWKALHRTAVSVLDTLKSVVPLPPSSSPLFHGGATLTVPCRNDAHTSASLFAPQKMTDKPPTPMQADTKPSNKMDEKIEVNSIVKKIPIKIIHDENGSKREGWQHDFSSGTTGSPEGLVESSTGIFSSLEQSIFCANTQQEPEKASNPSPEDTLTFSEAPQRTSPTCQPASLLSVTATEHYDEDVKREKLARDIMGKDKSLVEVLDQSKMMTTMDLMEGIYPQGEQLLEESQQRRKAIPRLSIPRNTEERRVEDDLAVSAASLVTSSSYYSTSAPKAELLIKMKDMQEHMGEQDSEDELDYDLSDKKQELIDSLSKKLQVLNEARESLLEDIQDNNALGDEVEATVQGICKPNELDKFRMFVGDLDKVVSLLLSLSGRLARVENALNNLEEGVAPEEKLTLTEKRNLLIRQHEDAKELKENLDRREHVVYSILASCLNEEQLADYEHFVKMKSALIIEQRKLEDKIKLGEEQLKCLKDSLPLDQRLI
ncbi:protein Shroom2 isoform X2 [Denticeps clupeoides]|uniref:protein Shroom2 isoform X2 n=1 Tax=Denticeps clupeoides TaxID=299321 RepID=UPI0010A456E2|nr:protein Shroom2-like isoform X2 [Denticeps clupeoides]